jgi:uncharacterized OB-fold protein
MSAPYWQACARHELKLPRCSQCGRLSLPPDIVCPHCRSAEPGWTWQAVSGRGKIRTWTVVRHSFLQGFDLPFVLADVELDDDPGVRMVGRLLDGPETDLALGDRVEVAFEDIADGIAIPSFRRAA